MFIGGPLLGLAFGDSWLVYALLALAYTVVAGLVSFFWPPLGWRTGLWFFAFFPLAYLFILFLTLDAVLNWRRELTSILLYSPSFIGACLGGWIGSTLRGRSPTNRAPNQPSSPHLRPTH